jgi:hypothetical protein
MALPYWKQQCCGSKIIFVDPRTALSLTSDPDPDFDAAFFQKAVLWSRIYFLALAVAISLPVNIFFVLNIKNWHIL